MALNQGWFMPGLVGDKAGNFGQVTFQYCRQFWTLGRSRVGDDL